MTKKKLRTLTVLLSMTMISASLLTACKTSKDTANKPAVEQGTDTEPTKEAEPAQEQPGEEVKPSEEAIPTEQAADKNSEKIEPITIEYKDTSKEYKDEATADVVLLAIEGNLPVVAIPNNEEASQKINDYFKQEDDGMHASAEENLATAKDDYASRAKINSVDDWIHYTVGSTYEMKRADQKCISFVSTDSFYFGGAHPSYNLRGCTFDAKTGKLLTLADITDDMSSFKSFIEEQIKLQCAEKKEEYMLFDDYETYIPEILADTAWYMDEDGFVVICNEYLISPHAAGPLKFTIPYENIKFLKNEYNKFADVDVQ